MLWNLCSVYFLKLFIFLNIIGIISRFSSVEVSRLLIIVIVIGVWKFVLFFRLSVIGIMFVVMVIVVMMMGWVCLW